MFLILHHSQFREKVQQDSLDAGFENWSSTADWYGHAPEIMTQSNDLRSLKLLPRLLHHPPGAIGIPLFYCGEAPPSLLERKATMIILAEYRAATASSRVFESYSCFVLGGKRREEAQLPLETLSPIISNQSGISLKAQKEHREHY